MIQQTGLYHNVLYFRNVITFCSYTFLHPQEKYGFPRDDFHETHRRLTASRADIKYRILSKHENKYGKYISPLVSKHFFFHWHYMEITGPSLTQVGNNCVNYSPYVKHNCR
jgi:hypothetical protein